jgi:hypothetical protein
MAIAPNIRAMKTKKNILSTSELVAYLKVFIEKNPEAVQLDGCSFNKTNGKAAVYFRYFDNGVSYKFHLNCDTKTYSIQTFLNLYSSHPENTLILAKTEAKKYCLRLRGHEAADGWFCYGNVEKFQVCPMLKAA